MLFFLCHHSRKHRPVFEAHSIHFTMRLTVNDICNIFKVWKMLTTCIAPTFLHKILVRRSLFKRKPLNHAIFSTVVITMPKRSTHFSHHSFCLLIWCMESQYRISNFTQCTKRFMHELCRSKMRDSVRTENNENRFSNTFLI